jgi:2-keto-myo-inositol isomerase
MTRRQALTRSGAIMAAVAGSTVTGTSSRAANHASHASFVYAMNTGTLRGHKFGLVRELEITAQAGFRAIEPWVEAIERYAKEGGSLNELKRRIEDLGLTVVCAIGFPEWVVDDEAQRARGFERARREMDLVARIGGQRLAAPPAGATNQPGLDLRKAAERYRALLELGDEMGVVPQVEVWGFSQNLNRLGDCAYVAIESGHPKAAVLADVFHLYKGGSDFHGLKQLSAQALQVFHMNDYPADPPRAEANDGHRVMPGDGVAPMTQILRDLALTGGETVLSLELFNRSYWEQDPLRVARLGLEKMKTAVAQAL